MALQVLWTSTYYQRWCGVVIKPVAIQFQLPIPESSFMVGGLLEPTAVGQVPRGPDSEMDICIEEAFWGVPQGNQIIL